MENEPLTSTVQRSHRVAVMGAAGGIGQPMSLLLKRSSLVSQLALYDIVATPGVAADLSHIETRSQVRCPRRYGVYTGTCREGRYGTLVDTCIATTRKSLLLCCSVS